MMLCDCPAVPPARHRPCAHTLPRLAAALLMAVAVLASVWVAFAVHRAERAQAVAERGHRHLVAGTALTSTGTYFQEHGIRSVPPVRAAWEYPRGRSRSGEVPVARPVERGERIRIWVDDRGSPTPEPRSTAGARGAAVVLGVACLLLGSSAAWGAHHAAAAVLLRGRLRTWEREWARVEPLWSGRAR
ncbi:hypothetical protein [Streptomyces sp. NPDC026673]|uniref:Rv1733c family protein n=1 Tax=Streptomyces sp. NPDC026673 TaxID=3155724 RepID=UPI00340E5FB1